MQQYTLIESTYTTSGTNGEFISSSKKIVPPPKNIQTNDKIKITYEEAIFYLAYSREQIKITYFQSLSDLKCDIIVLTPNTAAYSFSSNTQHDCLGQVAFLVEKHYGSIVSCNDPYRNPLPPL